MRAVIPFDGVCVVTFDPTTLMPTGEVVVNGLPADALPRMSEIEATEADFNRFAALALMPEPAASLYTATGGRLERSVRHREVRDPNGLAGDELRSALVDGSDLWGGLTLLRESGEPFGAADVRFLASLSGQLADGVRRSLVSVPVLDEAAESETGLLVLDDDNAIEMANAAAREWLAQLGFAGRRRTTLPAVIHAVASRARGIAAGVQSGPSATARLRTATGRWLIARGSLLDGFARRRTAVVLEPARPHSIFPLIARAYGLSEPERGVVELVARGLPTREIAGRMYLAPYTVQDHLKSVFGKVGVRSRGELVARLYLGGESSVPPGAES